MKIKQILGEGYGLGHITGPDDDGPQEVSWEEGMDDYFEWLGNSREAESWVLHPLEALGTLDDEKWVYPHPFIKKLYDDLASNPILAKTFELNPLEETFIFYTNLDDFLELFVKSPVKALMKYAFNYERIEKDKTSEIAHLVGEHMDAVYNDGQLSLPDADDGY